MNYFRILVMKMADYPKTVDVVEVVHLVVIPFARDHLAVAREFLDGLLYEAHASVHI